MDKRDEDRARKRVMVRYGVNGPTATAFTKNLSRSGLQVQTNNVLTPGTRIQVELKFPDRTFALWGVVVWAKRVPPQLAYTVPCGMGITFEAPPPEWLTFFERWHSSAG
jgi:hypothetical protein